MHRTLVPAPALDGLVKPCKIVERVKKEKPCTIATHVFPPKYVVAVDAVDIADSVQTCYKPAIFGPAQQDIFPAMSTVSCSLGKSASNMKAKPLHSRAEEQEGSPVPPLKRLRGRISPPRYQSSVEYH